MINEWLNKLKNLFIESKRVWLITKKPDKEEFKVISKVTGIGVLLIGLMGFIIALIWQLIKG